MAKPSPTQKSVYLHCSSIFSGANAQIRKPKKISQILSQHRKSIKILTNEFPLDAIAVVVKCLLDERVFESTSRARSRFPDLFQSSGTREAERKVSEAEAARSEAKAVLETVVTSDEEWEGEMLEVNASHGQEVLDPCPPKTIGMDTNVSTEEGEILNDVQQERHTDLIPRLHPVYLPFRTQHQILTMVQSMLEGCCFDFGNSYVPELMKTQKWDEAESVELTRWIQRFSKHARDLPKSATTVIAGKELMEVLFATSNLRHSAVHRLRTSAAGILKMVDAAVMFAQALNDPTRATTIENIKHHLSVAVEDIEQHQTLLERKLSDQLEDLARRKAEIEELERQAVEDMLSSDMSHRYTAGSAVEDFITVLQASHTCTAATSAEQDDGNADPGWEVGAKTVDEEETCIVQDYQNTYDDPPDREVAAEDQEITTAVYADDGSQARVQTADAESAMFSFTTVEREKYPDRSTLPEKRGSKAKRGYTGSWFFDEIASTVEDCDRPYSAADESFLTEHNSANRDFTSLVAIEHHQTNEENTPSENAAAAEALAQEEAPSIERDARIADSLDHDCAVAEDVDSYTAQMARDDEALLEAEMAADYNHSLSPFTAEQSPVPPLKQGLEKVSELPPRTSSGPLQSASVSDRPDDSPAAEKYRIVMNILDGPNRFTSMVCLDSTTKTAILNEAQTACQRRVAQGKEEQTEREIRYDSQLVSVRVDGFEVDLSTYDAEDLTFLIQTISNTSIPVFTVKIWPPPQL